MRRREFKMRVAANPILYQWLTENEQHLKDNPATLYYLTKHPDGLKHFHPGQKIDQQRIERESKLFWNERVKQRRPHVKSGGGLFGQLKSLFHEKTTRQPHASLNEPLPKIQRPALHAATSTHAVKRQSMPISLKIPKVNMNRKQVMDIISQTTDMLDVVGTLIGKVNHLR